MSKTLFKNCRLVNEDFKGHQSKMAFVVDNDHLNWIGPIKKIPKKLKAKEVDLKNKLVFPSFIECHTHSVFAGSRSEEFELRNKGVSYLEIASRGGGILSTVNQTRSISQNKLLDISQVRVNEFLRQGVSTLEIKSGYALDLKNEIKMLQVAKSLKGPQIITTYLGAHALPPEFTDRAEYLKYLCEFVLPIIKKRKLSNRVDIFIENKFFEKPESEAYLQKAKELGFQLTIHANQLSLSAGAQLAIKFEALSADHMIHLDDQLISQFSKSSCVAVLLPVADLYMKCAYPPARKLIDAGTTVALATDFNPGTCPSQDVSLVGLLARLEMKMTLPEVFKAYSEGAAKALGIFSEQGSFHIGKLANFISTDADLSDFFYSAGRMPKHDLFIRGKLCKRN